MSFERVKPNRWALRRVNPGPCATSYGLCHNDNMRLTVLSSGPLAPAALHGLVGGLGSTDTPLDDVICITNSTHDISVAGLRFWPDLDALRTAAQAAGGATVLAELQRQGVAPSGPWQGFDDAAVAAAIARGVRLARGADAVQCAAAQSSDLAVTVLPLTQEPIELHVVEEDGAGARQLLRCDRPRGRADPAGVAAGERHQRDRAVPRALDRTG